MGELVEMTNKEFIEALEEIINDAYLVPEIKYQLLVEAIDEMKEYILD